MRPGLRCKVITCCFWSVSAVRERFELSLSYGLYVMNFGEASDARFLCELAGEAEDAGWNGIFLTDTIMYYRDGREPVADSLTALAAIAVNTKHIRIGTAIASLPRRPPWLVAREAVTIDRLSDGRLTLGCWTWRSTGFRVSTVRTRKRGKDPRREA